MCDLVRLVHWVWRTLLCALLLQFNLFGSSDSNPGNTSTRGSVLESRLAQTRAVEQFYLPCDDEIFSEMSDVSLRQCLKGCMNQGALVEQELLGQFERVRTSYIRFQEALETQRTNS
ncbi:uncharacterized protein A4U43_C02F10770 [Asparagus officinalis]|uniref:Uncharacterized protein n=1 Tax=Asparagus officinalis TaxID=4686 RepID=A0A5P1FK68_ASPOF|nr:uncharacterized protein A4U43_C02F10770 [Asparagus officinalis]